MQEGYKLHALKSAYTFHAHLRNNRSKEDVISYFLNTSWNDPRIKRLIPKGSKIYTKLVKGMKSPATDGNTIYLIPEYFDEKFYENYVSDEVEYALATYILNTGIMVHEASHINLIKKWGFSDAKTTQ